MTRKRLGDRPLTAAEKQARYRARKAAGAVPARIAVRSPSIVARVPSAGRRPFASLSRFRLPARSGSTGCRRAWPARRRAKLWRRSVPSTWPSWRPYSRPWASVATSGRLATMPRPRGDRLADVGEARNLVLCTIAPVVRKRGAKGVANTYPPSGRRALTEPG